MILNKIRPSGLASLSITFQGAQDITASTTWNVGNSRTAGNVWSFETLDDQPTTGGTFSSKSLTCNNGIISPPLSFSLSGKLLSGGAIDASINGITGTTPPPTTTQQAPPTTAASPPAAAPQAATAPVATIPDAGAPKYVMSINAGSCWGAGTVSFVLNSQLSVNGQMPMGDANGGAQDITAASTWNVGNSKTTGNVWSFETKDDQPSLGGTFSSKSLTCTNGVISPPLTFSLSGQLLSGGPINPTITGAPAAPPSPPPAVMTPATPAAASPTAAAAPQAAQSQLPPATVGGCWGTGPIMFQVDLQISVNGEMPAGDANGGLAALQLSFVGAQDITAASVWNAAASSTSGNVWNFQTKDDQPDVGGIFQSASVTCVNGNVSPPLSFTLAGKLLTGGPINPSVA
ncbi:hypothetical protein HDU93_006947 [Gonapodya sp. JEL0774]|nr:hypothetical protein HDU93_006947 [Gonapodya sp. JEL0774]